MTRGDCGHGCAARSAGDAAKPSVGATVCDVVSVARRITDGGADAVARRMTVGDAPDEAVCTTAGTELAGAVGNAAGCSSGRCAIGRATLFPASASRARLSAVFEADVFKPPGTSSGVAAPGLET
jgi:hypothetical protein